MSSSRKITLAALLASALLVTPTQAQTGPSISALTLCAGAISATHNIDVLTYPRGAPSGEWSDVLGRILAQLNTMEGVEGMTGRYAASAARTHWNEQSRQERETAANSCRTRFGSN